MKMRLAELQRALRDVIRQQQRPVEPDDAEMREYLGKVAGSGRLPVLRHIIESWRAYDLERACPLTVAALRERMCWDDVLESFDSDSYSPFVEVLADRFLQSISNHRDRLIASVARFERACRVVLNGSDQRFVVLWDQRPEVVLARLATGVPLDSVAADRTYITTVCADFPSLFEVSIAPDRPSGAAAEPFMLAEQS